MSGVIVPCIGLAVALLRGLIEVHEAVARRTPRRRARVRCDVGGRGAAFAAARRVSSTR